MNVSILTTLRPCLHLCIDAFCNVIHMHMGFFFFARSCSFIMALNPHYWAKKANVLTPCNKYHCRHLSCDGNKKMAYAFLMHL